MLEGNVYRHIIKNSPMGYFYGELIWDESKELWDFTILDINRKFESIASLEEKQILGKSIVNVLPSFNKGNFNWIDFFQKIKGTPSDDSIEILVKSSNECFKVYCYYYKNNNFIIQLAEVEKKLHKEYTLIRELIGNLPFSAWAKDKNGRYIVINKSYELESGFSKEYIIGKTDYDLFDEALATQFTKQDNEVINDRDKLLTYEEYFNDEWHLLHKFAVYDKDKLLGIVGFSLNTHKEKMAKSEIQQKNKFLKILIDSIPDFIFYKDLKGIYLGFNESLATQYFGKHEGELIGKTYDELMGSNRLNEVFIKQDEEVISDKNVKIYEESLLLVDGSTREYETIKAPFYDENNEIAGILGISRDITHRNLVEKNLKESEEKFRQLAENIENMFLIYENDKVTYVSPGYEKIFGRDCTEIYKNIKNIFKHICHEDLHLIKEIKLTEAVDITFRIISADGTTKWVWLKGFPLKDHIGNVIRVLFIAQDLTTIKDAERELDRLRTEFFANLSHEFRTPLNLIFSSLQMVEFKLKQFNLENELGLRKYTNIIKQNSFRLLRLVNNLIDSTKIDAGYVEYNPENGDIVSFVKGIAYSVSDFASDKEIDIIFNSQIDKKIVAFDFDKMERIILNLISNGIKFNKPKGKIEIWLSAGDKFIEIHIKDYGIGIPEDKLSFVFERFRQVNNRLTKISEGSGIGLSLVKSLVEIHGGTIDVISTLGEGTEFIVKLPDVKVHEDDETAVTKDQVLYNSRVERIQIEFSDIYGLSL